MGLSRRDDGETSKDAAKGSKRSQQRRFYNLIKAHGPKGISDDRAHALLGYEHHVPRFDELRDQGRIVKTLRKEPSRRGRDSYVHVASVSLPKDPAALFECLTGISMDDLDYTPVNDEGDNPT